MTATQTLKIYQVLNKHFKSDEDASVVVQEIEEIVDKKIDTRKEILATKEDIARIELAVEKRYNSLILWIVSTGIAVIGLLLAFLKL
ncbi:MAG TPA: hypothetical protein VGI61_00490 [Parafilimonas sp.]|jgi:hypothetical protein